jgi:hypothetical protein
MVDKRQPTVEQGAKLLVIYGDLESYFNAQMFLYAFHYEVLC